MNYIVTDTELTASANEIRAKTGDASPIEWENSTGFADAIAAIPSGGGIPAPVAKIAAGTATILAASTVIEVAHDLGVTPDFFMIQRVGAPWSDIPLGTCYCVTGWVNNMVESGYLMNLYGYYGYWYKHGTSGNNLNGTYNYPASSDISSTKFRFNRGAADWQPGSYNWVLVKLGGTI